MIDTLSFSSSESSSSFHIDPHAWFAGYVAFTVFNSVFFVIVAVRLVYLVFVSIKITRSQSDPEMVNNYGVDMVPKLCFFTAMTASRLVNMVCFVFLADVMNDPDASLMDPLSDNAIVITIGQYVGNAVFVLMVVCNIILVIKTLNASHEQFKKSGGYSIRSAALGCCCRLPVTVSKSVEISYYVLCVGMSVSVAVCLIKFAVGDDAASRDPHGAIVNTLRYILSACYIICGITLFVTSIIVTSLYKEQSRALNCEKMKVFLLLFPTSFLLVVRGVKEIIYVQLRLTRYQQDMHFFLVYNIFFDLIPSLLLTILMWPLPHIEEISNDDTNNGDGESSLRNITSDRLIDNPCDDE